MKKLLLATAVAALSVSAANAAPTLYGKAFVTADYVDAEIDYPSDAIDREDRNEDTVEINSTGSRIGLRGSEAMTADTDVVYQLEYGIRVDGDDRTFQSRDTYLGLSNNTFGEFRAGRNIAVLDYINNVSRNVGYWDNIGSSTLRDNDSLAEALTLSDATRINNSVVWIAPKYQDLPLELALMYGADEGFDDGDNGFGASLFFDQGLGVTAGIAYDKDMSLSVDGERPAVNAGGDPIPGPDGDQLIFTPGGDIIRGTASIDLGRFTAYPVVLAGLYQQADYDFENAEKEKAFVISGEMALSNFARPAAVYLQYDNTKNVGGIDNLDSDQVVLGGKYMYKDNMIAHAYAGVNSADRGATDADVLAIGGGLEYLF